jgi:hypothetical protein
VELRLPALRRQRRAGGPARRPPRPGLRNLLPNHWYRLSVTWSFDSNSILSTSITDLSTGSITTAAPEGWYLLGGANPSGLGLPGAVRFFAGGQGGNIVAADNYSLTPGGSAPPCDPDYNQDGNADQDDVRYLVDVIAGAPNPTGRDPDFNLDGNADQDDVRALVNVIAGGPCP